MRNRGVWISTKATGPLRIRATDNEELAAELGFTEWDEERQQYVAPVAGEEADYGAEGELEEEPVRPKDSDSAATWKAYAAAVDEWDGVPEDERPDYDKKTKADLIVEYGQEAE